MLRLCQCGHFHSSVFHRPLRRENYPFGRNNNDKNEVVDVSILVTVRNSDGTVPDVDHHCGTFPNCRCSSFRAVKVSQ